MKKAYHLLFSAILLAGIFFLGFSRKSHQFNDYYIQWSETPLTWENFKLTWSLDDEYVATIYSGIECPDLITNDDSEVYAYMLPGYSQRLIGEYDDGYNTLVHEQYHFNITEYCARLMRKEIVNRGIGGLSYKTMASLQLKYQNKLDSLQNVYDSITDHNVNTDPQRFWELQIDDWLRETAYYADSDIYSYHQFTEDRTSYYKKLYLNSNYEPLLSYPVGKRDVEKGVTYEIQYPKRGETLIKFYRDGKITNGGLFQSGIVRILRNKDQSIELHYLNPNETYNKELDYCIKKILVDENKNHMVHYYNYSNKRTWGDGAFETRWSYNAKRHYYYTSSYNEKGKLIAFDKKGVYHERIWLDKKYRVISREYLDKGNRPKNNRQYFAREEYTLNDSNLASEIRYFDQSGKYAYHLDDYRLAYQYDERGNPTLVTSLNEKGGITYDSHGAAIYELTYDLYDHRVVIKRFNKDHQPIINEDNIFKEVKDYDQQGRPVFRADYYPGNVLKYSQDRWGATTYQYIGDSIVREINTNGYGQTQNNLNGVAIVLKKIDKSKRVLSESYLDAEEELTESKNGVAQYRYKYDDKGQLIEKASYNKSNQLTASEDGIAIVRNEYDKNGFVSKTANYSVENELIVSDLHFAYQTLKYNKEGLLAEEACFDNEGNPMEYRGSHKTSYQYNSVGKVALKRLFDSLSRPKKGVAMVHTHYNKYDNIKRIASYDDKKRPAVDESGVHATVYRYNKRQYRISNLFYDTKNRLTNNYSGYAEERWSLDELGHVLDYSYLNKLGRPALGPEGYHRVKYQWAPLGEAEKIWYYDTNNQLQEDSEGVAIYEYELWSSGIIAEVRRYNQKGNLTENKDGVARTTYLYSLDGLYYLDQKFDLEDQVIPEEDEAVEEETVEE